MASTTAMHWLDANKDGVINATDPAFAAIKLWVDVNQDGVMQAGEGQSLKALQDVQNQKRCYLINSDLRKFHEHYSYISPTSANQDQWHKVA